MSIEDKLTLIKGAIKQFPDFPKSGVIFKDIFPIFTKPDIVEVMIDIFCFRYKEKFGTTKVNAVVGLEARGFLIGPLLALKLNAAFVPLRKKGKLPGKLLSQSYSLEYGEATIELQENAINQNDNVIIVDDLLATGGTMAAACELMRQCGANILECMCIIELTGLKGAKKLPSNVSSYSIVQYEY